MGPFSDEHRKTNGLTLNYRVYDVSSNSQRCCRGRGRNVADVHHALGIDKMKVVNQLSIDVECLSAHPRSARHKIL